MKTVKKHGFTIHPVSTETNVSLPFVGTIKAGFPSPAQDYMGDTIDLNRLLIKNKASTFLAKTNGDSMIWENIENGDILLVDKSLEPHDGSTVVCFIDGEFTMKTVHINKDEILLVPANPNYPVIHITEENQFIIWGVVTYSIRKHI